MKLYDYEIEHNALVRQLAPECTLLLKRDGAFPLGHPGRIALFGNGARHTVRGGTGSGEVYSRYIVNMEDGLKEAGFEITSTKWLDDYDELMQKATEQWKAEMKQKYKGIQGIMKMMGAIMPEPAYRLSLDYEGQAAVYVLSRISGEGNDRKNEAGDVQLTETEIRDICELNRKFKRFLLVLNTGGVVDLSPVLEVRNILVFSQLGHLSGEILADLLLGKFYPSGKLATTWAKAEDYCHQGSFGEEYDTEYKEGIYVGYRYFDSAEKKPLFPFGFGLSYSDFEITNAEVSLQGSLVSVEAEVRNAGLFNGKETVQLYVSLPAGKLDQPYQMLAAFGKSRELKPAERDKVKVSFNMSELAGYDEEKARYLLEKGQYVLRLGNSSRNTKVIGVIELDEDAVIRTGRNVLGESGFKDWKAPERKEENLDDVKHYPLSHKLFETVDTVYEHEEVIEPFVKTLNDRELCYVNIGSFSGGLLSIVGNASQKVAGAAGDLTAVLEDKGFPCVATADGPAGLRISQRYFLDRKGRVNPVGNDMLAVLGNGLPKAAIKVMEALEKKPKATDKIYEQYCTMIPIATALAQSFNTELVEKLADMVGDEMERFHVNFWLAPAMNIHRDIRCGRNFEYYSEDPLISGKMAAAITRGVQKHPGCSVTIKHYAANNQETNRYNNNSHVSERAMREIYLKGFGICVRESQPKAVMTSYNLLNGIHTSEHRGLIEDILRREYGFKGIVMTDWIVSLMSGKSKYPAPLSWKIARAGGDVVMPGSKSDYKTLYEGLKAGYVSRNQLEINASRMYRMVNALDKAARGK